MNSPSRWLGAIALEAPCPYCISGTVVRSDGDRMTPDHCDICGGAGRLPVRASERLRRFVRPLGEI